MKELQAILFPHSHLREQDIKKIFPFLGPVTIFQPWFMAPPNFLSQKDYQDAVKILNPPSHMKPEEDFKGLLAEYKTWIKHNRDKSRAAFLKVGREMRPAEDTTWEIREALRGPSRAQQNRERGHSLKWHLILHLARDMEKDRQEADRMLKGLKAKESPLQDLLDEEDVKNPLTDLSQFESDPGTPSYPMELVFDAWLGLFGEYLKGGDLLLTISRHVMDYASEVWDASEEKSGRVHESLIRDLGKGHKSDLSRLEKLSKEVEAVYKKELSEKTLHVTMKDFSPFSNQHTIEGSGVLKYISGKTMILVEEESRNE